MPTAWINERQAENSKRRSRSEIPKRRSKRGRTQMSAKVRKNAQKVVQKGTNKRKRARPCKNAELREFPIRKEDGEIEDASPRSWS